MKIETFELERTQSLWENTVEYNLTETGIHPLTLEELLDDRELRRLHAVRIGYGQTNGSIELREAICALYPGTDRENVLVTSGSCEANFVTIWSLLEPRDELVLMLPNYMQIWGVANAFQIKVKPFYLKEELRWQPDLDELTALITPKTKMIAVCNPNNPTGAVLSEEARREIIRLAKQAGAWLYADEIYRGAEFSGQETPSFWKTYEKAIVAGGLSKAYALPGLRIGWLVGPHREIADCWARRDYTTIATAILSNRIAALALQPELRARILRRNRNVLQENIAVLKAWADGRKGLFRFIPPMAGGMVFLKYDLDINSTELVTKIRREKRTFIVAGDCFGMDRRLRIGIGSEKEYLTAGLRRIGETLEEIR
ncbi:MAG: aminotransferase class I/II-fold pyridoxal phosphate-dependent enzyme [Candidatus Aminicenantes bacterium]|nr:aminotransferase class I/II-fold pyridoxal phosphate-dependent enzyme [Candidatus Aminicenantes bacterium]